MKSDLTNYGDSELSMWVMNDEGLYNMRHNVETLFYFLDELFIYTEDQKDELIQDLTDEEEEL